MGQTSRCYAKHCNTSLTQLFVSDIRKNSSFRLCCVWVRKRIVCVTHEIDSKFRLFDTISLSTTPTSFLLLLHPALVSMVQLKNLKGLLIFYLLAHNVDSVFHQINLSFQFVPFNQLVIPFIKGDLYNYKKFNSISKSTH